MVPGRMPCVASTYGVVAAVHIKLGSEGDGTAEPEEGVEDVEAERDHGVAGHGLFECDSAQVEEREHGEDGNEHGVVNDARAAAVVGDHVADKGHEEESPEELRGRISMRTTGEDGACDGRRHGGQRVPGKPGGRCLRSWPLLGWWGVGGGIGWEWTWSMVRGDEDGEEDEARELAEEACARFLRLGFLGPGPSGQCIWSVT